MEEKLDSGVLTVLNALDVTHYAPVFQKYGVTMKIFTTLNEHDLRTMGIEEKDLEPILKYAKKLGKTDPKRIDLDLTSDDVRKGINAIEQHLKQIDASLAYTLDDFNPDDWTDEMADEQTLSEITARTSAHVRKTCGEFSDVLDQLLIKDVAKPETNSSKIVMVTVLVAAITALLFKNFY